MVLNRTPLDRQLVPERPDTTRLWALTRGDVYWIVRTMPLSAQWKSFIAGVLVANSAPHLACAVTGHEQLTPLAGRRSSPTVNLTWGAMNLGAGLMLVRRLNDADASPRWDRRLVWFEAGASAFAAWFAITEAIFPGNSDSR